MKLPNVDELAQQIRLLNGDGKMGAGMLAEKLLEWFAAQPKADSAEPKACATCGGRGVIARSFRDGDEYDACPECNTPSPVNPASAQAWEVVSLDRKITFKGKDYMGTLFACIERAYEAGQEDAALRPKAQPLTELLEIARLLSLASGEFDDAANGTHYVAKDGKIRCKGSFLDLIERARIAIASPTKGEGRLSYFQGGGES